MSFQEFLQYKNIIVLSLSFLRLLVSLISSSLSLPDKVASLHPYARYSINVTLNALAAISGAFKFHAAAHVA